MARDEGFSSQVDSEKQELKEAQLERAGVLSLDIEDEELVRRINSSVTRGMNLYSEKKELADRNEKYWKGDQLDYSELEDHEAKIVDNIIFRNTETLTSMISKRPPELTIYSSNRDYGTKIRKLLQSRWEVQDKMQRKGREAIRYDQLYYIGPLKYRYDNEYDEIISETVLPSKLVVDPNATSLQNCEWVAEFIDHMNVKEIIEEYELDDDKQEELFKELGFGEMSEDDKSKVLGTKIQFLEFNTPEFTAWKYGDVILDKIKNPNWNWDEENKNIFHKPQVPYVFYSFLNLGEDLYSTTTLIEQAIPLQDGYNKRKRQISDNADRAQGTLVASGIGITKEEFEKVNQEPGEKIWFDADVPVGDTIGVVGGNPMESYVFEDMLHTQKEMDSIFGTHDVTRGERGKTETATGQVLRVKRDLGRAEDPISSYEDFCEDWYRAMLQMMIVHFTNEHRYSFDENEDFVVSKDELIKQFSTRVETETNPQTGETTERMKEGEFIRPVLMVKPNSTMPVDEVAQRNEAINLWGGGALDPITLFERLNWPDPEQTARRLFMWKAAPQMLFPELAMQMQGGQGQAQSEGAVKDWQQLMEGGQVQPNAELRDPKTAKAHIETHSAQMDSSKFQNAQDEIKQATVQHVRAEVDLAKRVVNSRVERAQSAPKGGQQNAQRS